MSYLILRAISEPKYININLKVSGVFYSIFKELFWTYVLLILELLQNLLCLLIHHTTIDHTIGPIWFDLVNPVEID